MSMMKNLSNTLFPRVRQCVLGMLYAHPDRDFYTNEIIKQIGMGTGSVQRELEKLSNVGLINVQWVGNQKRYRANPDNPLFKELRSITVKTFGLGDILQEVLEPLRKQIQFAFIYGSVAKQSDTANSDIDVMLIGDDLTYSDFFNTVTDAESKLERKINPTFHTSQEWKQKMKEKNHFITTIINEPKIFLIGAEDALKKLR